MIKFVWNWEPCQIDKKEKELAKNLNLDQERKDRPLQVMHEEAAQLRALF